MASPGPSLSFRSIPQGAALVQTSHFTFEKTGSRRLRLRVITHLLSGDACKEKHSVSVPVLQRRTRKAREIKRNS